MADPNLQAAQQTIDSLNAQIFALKQRKTLNLKDVVKAGIPGWNGKLGIHMMGWFGDGNPHRVTRYKSNDPAVIKAQLDALQAVGFELVILTWKGHGNFVDQTAAVLIPELFHRGMQFAYLLDPWIARNKPDPTQAVIGNLGASNGVLTDPLYLHDGSEPMVCEFSLGNVGVDLGKLRQARPDLNILSWHSGYTWPNIPPLSLATLKAEHAKVTMRIATVCPMFNDAGFPLPDGTRDYCHEVWDRTKPARVIDHQAGNWFHDQLTTIPASMPVVCLASLNDHDEGHGIEHFLSLITGIRIGT